MELKKSIHFSEGKSVKWVISCLEENFQLIVSLCNTWFKKKNVFTLKFFCTDLYSVSNVFVFGSEHPPCWWRMLLNEFWMCNQPNKQSGIEIYSEDISLLCWGSRLLSSLTPMVHLRWESCVHLFQSPWNLTCSEGKAVFFSSYPSSTLHIPFIFSVTLLPKSCLHYLFVISSTWNGLLGI